MRIGILGGSFNPIHNGHLFMAKIAQQKLCLDKVIFMPAFCSPHKMTQQMPDESHRMNMIKLAIEGKPDLMLSDLEIKRGGVSYTVDTLRQLKRKYKNDQLFWIIGEDNIKGLYSWKNFDEILKMASFIAVSRAFVKVSSSEIRQGIKNKRSIRYLLPNAVIRYIKQYHLYFF